MRGPALLFVLRLAFLVDEETWLGVRGARETLERRGLFGSLRTARAQPLSVMNRR